MTLGMGLVPIAPIILLPFIIIFFVIIFPIWLVALGVLGLLLLVARGINLVFKSAGSSAFEGVANALHTAFRWVLTFAGFTKRLSRHDQPTA